MTCTFLDGESSNDGRNNEKYDRKRDESCENTAIKTFTFWLVNA